MVRTGVFEVVDGSAEARSGVVVVLFGWVGSTPKLVGKYAAEVVASPDVHRVYHTTAPTWDVFVNPRGLRKLARSSLDLLAHSHSGMPAVLMSMSNGGAFVHRHILRLLAEDARLPAASRRYGQVVIAGTVFDSAPAYITFASGSRALTEGIKSPLARRLAYWLARLVLPLLLVLVFGLNAGEEYWGELTADPLPCPSLYIYSAHDTLTDAARLDELVAARRARRAAAAGAGAGVAAAGTGAGAGAVAVANAGAAAGAGAGPEGVRVLFIAASEQPSPHVAHLLRHPEPYRRALHGLLATAAAAAAAGGGAEGDRIKKGR